MPLGLHRACPLHQRSRRSRASTPTARRCNALRLRAGGETGRVMSFVGSWSRINVAALCHLWLIGEGELRRVRGYATRRGAGGGGDPTIITYPQRFSGRLAILTGESGRECQEPSREPCLRPDRGLFAVNYTLGSGYGRERRVAIVQLGTQSGWQHTGLVSRT